MLSILQVITLMLAALAMAPAVAHALELPGKMRLPKDTYVAVQSIYYPGFTIAGGFGELLGMLATFALLLFIPRDTTAFWLTLFAFVALVLMHAVFWVFTQPVNRFWLRDQHMTRASTAFFRLRRAGIEGTPPDWRTLRDQWEFSHVARAALAVAAVGLLASAMVTS
jgi:hypothetical protein